LTPFFDSVAVVKRKSNVELFEECVGIKIHTSDCFKLLTVYHYFICDLTVLNETEFFNFKNEIYTDISMSL